MAKQRSTKEDKKISEPHQWGLEEMMKDLLDSGAVEIPKEDWDKEPFKTYMKNVKKDGKFICD